MHCFGTRVSLDELVCTHFMPDTSTSYKSSPAIGESCLGRGCGVLRCPPHPLKERACLWPACLCPACLWACHRKKGASDVGGGGLCQDRHKPCAGLERLDVPLLHQCHGRKLETAVSLFRYGVEYNCVTTTQWIQVQSLNTVELFTTTYLVVFRRRCQHEGNTHDEPLVP